MIIITFIGDYPWVSGDHYLEMRWGYASFGKESFWHPTIVPASSDTPQGLVKDVLVRFLPNGVPLKYGAL